MTEAFVDEHADLTLDAGPALVELQGVGKSYGAVRALNAIDLRVNAGEVTCVVGESGAGKSTLAKIMSGVHPPTEGKLLVDGDEVRFGSPREALEHGIAAVYQDLALVSVMEVWRNFFLGAELRRGNFPFAPLDDAAMRQIAGEQLQRMGMPATDVDQPVGTLSAGDRHCVAIARAIHFGARVLILDEPTAALGVKQSGIVLHYTTAARDIGLGVVLITHNPHYAYLVGDHFVLLRLGHRIMNSERDDVTLENLIVEMAGGQELAQLSHEFKR